MTRTLATLLSFLILLCFCGCERQCYNPYRIERAELMANTRTIGILPLAIDKTAMEHFNIDVDEERKIQFESLLEIKLKEAGFAVVSASEYRSIRASIETTVGLSDGQQLDTAQEQQYEFIHEHTQKEYLAKHQIDAFACPEIVLTRASWGGQDAEWHGASEAVAGKKGILELIVTSNTTGYTPALSFKLSLYDLDETLYYRYYGGLQLLQWVNTGLNFKGNFIDVPKDQILGLPAKNEKSIEIACAPLIYEQIPSEYKIYRDYLDTLD